MTPKKIEDRGLTFIRFGCSKTPAEIKIRELFPLAAWPPSTLTTGFLSTRSKFTDLPRLMELYSGTRSL
jgi:hypothetical protein